MRYFFSSDWHLGHSNIIKYCKRPFLSQEEASLLDLANKGVIPIKDFVISRQSTDRMNQTIIDSTNAVVKKEDYLILAGDFCWLPRNKSNLAINIIKGYISKINCKNIFIICGNHDDRKTLIASNCFKGVFEQYTFNVNGQKVFVSHYPCRSWESSFYGSWHVYGHVHNSLWNEDNGKLSKYQNIVYGREFSKILSETNLTDEQQKNILEKLLEASALTNGIDYSLDVGVDNRKDLVSPWGTPWSFDDIFFHFMQRKSKWEERKKHLSEVSF